MDWLRKKTNSILLNIKNSNQELKINKSYLLFLLAPLGVLVYTFALSLSSVDMEGESWPAVLTGGVLDEGVVDGGLGVVVVEGLGGVVDGALVELSEALSSELWSDDSSAVVAEEENAEVARVLNLDLPWVEKRADLPGLIGLAVSVSIGS